ncbi:MAG: SUMF1/EgtB/PvdO family nonheme iron enzyme [Polyangiaceae bacterium]|nr:SUMF1/EgtB/PvdO family nonheme iron enzyme [Polyangiaceae bacterium]
MVEITGPADEKFCIDVREATNEEYGKFQAAAGNPKQGAPCAWNTTFGSNHALNKKDEPAFSLDWCDALAFCKSLGKRLCGRMDGQPVAYPNEFSDPAKSEWHYVCTNGGTTLYPWGAAYTPDTCNGHSVSNPVAPVMSYPACHGQSAPFDQVFDMAGNVAEWTNNCETTNQGESDKCILRGGSYFSAPANDQLKCGSDLETSPRGQDNTDFGVRCCKDY